MDKHKIKGSNILIKVFKAMVIGYVLSICLFCIFSPWDGECYIYILITLSRKCLLQNCAENRLKIYIMSCQKAIGLQTKHKLSTHHVPN